MLMPRRTKYRKYQRRRGSLTGVSNRGCNVTFGEFGLKAMGRGEITNRQIESARVAITRYLKRDGKVWIRIFPCFPLTKKPAETRMGKGKGSPEVWVTPVKPGRILYEVGNVSEEKAIRALKLASYKLGIPTRIVKEQSI
jgi:large subunit ribosomal protein L16